MFKLISLLLVVIPILYSHFLYAFNQDQLWLPRDYYRHLRALYKAAELSEQTERCQYVIAGTLSQERSTKDHPVFVVTCRDQERQTFAYIVDGLSMEILNRPPPPDPELLAERELQLVLEKKWLACYEQIKKRTQGLRAIAMNQDMPEAHMDNDNNIAFIVDFNATSMDGFALRYRANCQYAGDSKVVDINRSIEVVQESPEATVESASN
jgi:hypothetical protein